MSDIAIKFENISKQYRLGTIGTGTLSHDLKRWWTVNIIGKEDPYLKIGSVNDRGTKADSDYVWALRDINFDVKQGEVLGIIGKNGAGKSTLLKILSRVTTPTTGVIKAKGRIASLLEVGTGFHQEMTGRENIFMNGSIMGMTKAEIRRKFDEIVDFAGIERYIDTPVKRYSSGMIVRLGFAIAAHLEPEILVVDEVLAVGDAEFQKKAIGKMQDVSHTEGRTVLFVSHNMAAVSQLCQTGLLLKNGVIKTNGLIRGVIDEYLMDTIINRTCEIDLDSIARINENYGNTVKMKRLLFNNGNKIINGDPLEVLLEFEIKKEVDEIVAGIAFTTLEGQRLLTIDSDITINNSNNKEFGNRLGNAGILLTLPRNDLQPGQFSIDVALRTSSETMYDLIIGASILEVMAGAKTPGQIINSSVMGGLRIPTYCQTI